VPELPEVEYTARQLRHAIVDATIAGALVFWQRSIGHPDLPDFLAGIAQSRILGVRRRGKFLVMDLEGELLLTIHRRMSGNLLLLPPGWEIDTSLRESDLATWDRKGPTFSIRETHSEQQGNQQTIVSSPKTAYCRVCFNLTDGRRLLFTDPRKFGRIELWPREQEAEALERLGPEPLSDEFTVESLAQRLVGRRGAIKQVLLSQEVIAGLGNIYADEALFYARIHPLRRAGSLTVEEVRWLHEGIIAVLTLGIEHGGTSFNEYRDLWGEAGDNYDHVRVYQQEGKPCPRCGTLIERIVVGQRGTHFCPTCQKLIPE
jgi:formamidopyrimidine-DNA glycosylase